MHAATNLVHIFRKGLNLDRLRVMRPVTMALMLAPRLPTKATKNVSATMFSRVGISEKGLVSIKWLMITTLIRYSTPTGRMEPARAVWS